MLLEKRLVTKKFCFFWIKNLLMYSYEYVPERPIFVVDVMMCDITGSFIPKPVE